MLRRVVDGYTLSEPDVAAGGFSGQQVAAYVVAGLAALRTGDLD